MTQTGIIRFITPENLKEGDEIIIGKYVRRVTYNVDKKIGIYSLGEYDISELKQAVVEYTGLPLNQIGSAFKKLPILDLQLVLDKGLKDGDGVEFEIKKNFDKTPVHKYLEESANLIFKEEVKEESWDEIFIKSGFRDSRFESFMKFLEQNYYPPIKRK